MTITEPVYATRDAVKRALEIRDTARASDQIDRLLQASRVSIDGSLHRTFYPRLGTIKRDWPTTNAPTPWRIWLDADELVSVTSLVSGGVSIPTNSLILYPYSGPPYNRVEIDISTSSTFTVGSTHQNSIVISGVLGYSLTLSSVGGLVAAINDSVTSVTVPNGALVGVGDLIKIGDEYLLVSERGWVDSTQNLQTPLTASAANTTVAVSTGSAFSSGEVVLLDSERMLIVDVAGNNLAVKRAWDGSALAGHSGSDVYVSRLMTVARGVVGSTAASHLITAAIDRWVPPPLLTQLNIAEALNAIEQEQSAYARVVGSGDNAFEARGAGLLDVRDRACTALGRKNRHRAV